MIARGVRLGLLGLACLGMAGCRHKVTAVVPQAAKTTVPLEKPPEPANPPVMKQVPLTTAPLPSVQVQEKKVKKPRKKPAPVIPAAAVLPSLPVQVASAGPPPAPGTAIGALTVGGGESPEKKKQATAMLAELEKRIGGLGADVMEKQKEGIVRVRYFEKEAKTALDTGDAEGAVSLATKAKVLLDDLVK